MYLFVSEASLIFQYINLFFLAGTFLLPIIILFSLRKQKLSCPASAAWISVIILIPLSGMLILL